MARYIITMGSHQRNKEKAILKAQAKISVDELIHDMTKFAACFKVACKKLSEKDPSKTQKEWIEEIQNEVENMAKKYEKEETDGVQH